jgi:hypothetical protein
MKFDPNEKDSKVLKGGLLTPGLHIMIIVNCQFKTSKAGDPMVTFDATEIDPESLDFGKNAMFNNVVIKKGEVIKDGPAKGMRRRGGYDFFMDIVHAVGQEETFDLSSDEELEKAICYKPLAFRTRIVNNEYNGETKERVSLVEALPLSPDQIAKLGRHFGKTLLPNGLKKAESKNVESEFDVFNDSDIPF